MTGFSLYPPASLRTPRSTRSQMRSFEPGFASSSSMSASGTDRTYRHTATGCLGGGFHASASSGYSTRKRTVYTCTDGTPGTARRHTSASSTGNESSVIVSGAVPTCNAHVTRLCNATSNNYIQERPRSVLSILEGSVFAHVLTRFFRPARDARTRENASST